MYFLSVCKTLPGAVGNKRLLVSGLLTLLIALPCRAHPHSWIDIKTRILGSDQAITGLKMEWTFDAMTTAYLFDGEDMSPAQQEKTLHKLAASVMTNMLSQHYFTYFYDNQTPIRYQSVDTGQLSTAKGKATLSFSLPLAKPYPLNGHKLTLKIFDPTYYVDMSWKDSHDISFAPRLQDHCQQKLVEPNPTSAQISYAMSLPMDADPDNKLGQLFTQTLELSCKAQS
ncbi:DUF1007 family protein [Vibrio ostreae]|uniref:DUF1007 family protein n=2 Tax=Vibrionaceae TaxID=641 RepID=A0A975U7P6_9VIBR|nr:DUF1007 family protein [Vibrio ostreae]WGY45927.1 DUF1007 family protein [Vibrio sp. ABG19]